MPYHRPGRVVRATAGVDVRHGAAAADDGFVGEVVKTETPAQDAVRANLDLVVAGEKYNMIVSGIIEVPLTGLESGAKGDLVYIATSNNALSLTATSKVPLGKIHSLAGEQGGRTDRLRVNLNEKA